VELDLRRAVPKPASFMCRITEEERQLWKAAAKKAGVPVSELVRAAVRSACADLLNV
jgi:hypothetical protein